MAVLDYRFGKVSKTVSSLCEKVNPYNHIKVKHLLIYFNVGRAFTAKRQG